MRQTPERLRELYKLLQSKVHLKSIVMTLAVLVVFVTTYVLILPAFTLDKEEAAEQGGIDVVAVEQQAETETEDVQVEETAEPEAKEEAADNIEKNDTDTAKAETEKAESTDGEEKVELLTAKTNLKANGEDFVVSATVDAQSEVPADTSLAVKELGESTKGFDYEQYKQEALEALQKENSSIKDIRMIKFYDISLESDTQDKSVEPSDTVSVKIAYDKGIKVSDANNIHIVHFGEQKTEVLDTNATVNSKSQLTEASFETDGFSVYAVVEEGNGENARATVNFYGLNNQLVATYYVKNGDVLLPEDGTRDDGVQYIEDIVADPGIGGKVGEDQSFRGWYIAEEGGADDYTSETEPLTIEDVQKYLADLSITEGDVVNVYAMIFKHFYVTYYGDDKDVALGTHTALARLSDRSTSYVVNMAYTPDAHQDFKGWTTTAEDGGNHISGWTDENKVYENGTEITIDGNVTFNVKAPEGNWLVYNTNGKGGTYNAPQFYLFDEVTEPAAGATEQNMKRNGYTFIDWREAADYDDEGNPIKDENGNIILKDEAFEFGHKLTENTNIYANWRPKDTAPYTVIFWTQNTDRTAYDVAGSYTGSGPVGEQIPIDFRNNIDEDYVGSVGNNGHYTGFCLNHDSEDTLGNLLKTNSYDSQGNPVTEVVAVPTITPEGDAVLNLYFDRIEYEFRFYYYQETTQGRPPTVQYNVARYSASYNGDGVYGVAQWHGWGNTHPSQTYGPDQVATVEGTTAHYFVLNAYYGEDISSTWPKYEQLGDYTRGDNTYSAVSYIMMNGTGLKKEANPNGYGTARGSDTIKGLITIMDESILGKTNDADGNFVVLRYYTKNTWQYHIFYEQVDGVDYTGKTTYTLDGVDYYEDHVVDSRSTNANVSEQNHPQYTGFEYVAESNQTGQSGGTSGNNARWTTGTGNNTVYHVRYYYQRKLYDIAFMDGVYVDGNNNLIQSRASELLEQNEENIMQGATIPETYTGFVPDLPAGENGYVFEGWYLDEACTTPYEWGTMPIGGITVHAKWRQIQYRVFLHPNAGESGSNDLDWGSENQEMNFRVAYGEKVSTPTGRISDKEFVGWYLDPQFKKVFSEDAFVLNETTVTADYDKDADMTDDMDKWGNIDPNSPKPAGTSGPGYNGDKYAYNDATGAFTERDRFWITKKLDLYAKWRDKLVGAQGINVVYDATDLGVEGSEPTDNLLYQDTAEAVAQAACTPADEEKNSFYCWVVQKWDEETHAFVDTAVEVFPGQEFTILAADAQVVPDPEDPEKQTYTIQLRATYKPVTNTVPTHITWYANNGTGDTVTDDKVGLRPLQINESVDVRPNTTFTNPGHEFLGWARLIEETADDGTTVIKVEGHPVENLNIDTLDESDLWLRYDPDDGKYYSTENTGTGIDEGTEIKKVAADERLEYHGLVAVWSKKTYTVTVIKTVGDPSDEEVPFNFTPQFTAMSGTDYSSPFDLVGKEGGSTQGGTTYPHSKTFANIPYGTEFSITEAVNQYYDLESAKYTVTDADDSSKNVEDVSYNNGGSLTVDGNTTITFNNVKKIYDITIKKTDDQGNKKDGAVFKVNRMGDTTYKYYMDDITVGEETYPFETGDYQLIETNAPNGFIIAKNAVTFTVNANGSVTITSDDTIPETGEPIATANQKDGKWTVSIKNVPGKPLPHTGGIGTTIFYILGGILVIGCGVVLVARKRMGAQK